MFTTIKERMRNIITKAESTKIGSKTKEFFENAFSRNESGEINILSYAKETIFNIKDFITNNDCSKATNDVTEKSVPRIIKIAKKIYGKFSKLMNSEKFIGKVLRFLRSVVVIGVGLAFSVVTIYYTIKLLPKIFISIATIFGVVLATEIILSIISRFTKTNTQTA